MLGAFTFQWRSALVSTVAIAMSLAAAWLVLFFTDTTVNTMVLAGLVMALVVLIDDAVIDVDNVARRVRQQRAQGDGTPAWQVVIDATLEMRSAILFATLIVVAVLLPAFFMEGEAGAFLPPIAAAYLLAVVVSIVVAVTVTPALGMMLLGDPARERRESPVARWTQRMYDRLARRTVPKPGPRSPSSACSSSPDSWRVPFLDQSMRPVLRSGTWWCVSTPSPAPRSNAWTRSRHRRLRNFGRCPASTMWGPRRACRPIGSDRERQLRRGLGQRRASRPTTGTRSPRSSRLPPASPTSRTTC